MRAAGLILLVLLVVLASSGQQIFRPTTPATPPGGGGAVAFNESFGVLPSRVSNTVWTLPQAPTAGTLRLFVNGLRLKQGVDYSITGATITFSSYYGDAIAADAGAIVQADYRY